MVCDFKSENLTCKLKICKIIKEKCYGGGVFVNALLSGPSWY